jgi:hypothetical protein
MLDPADFAQQQWIPRSSRSCKEDLMPHRRSNVRRVAVFAAMVTLLGAASVMLSQCTMVGDNVTGVDLSKGRPTTCVKQCNDFYKMLFDQEAKLHQTNVEACGQDNGACKQAEDARHTARMAELGQAKIDCQNGCHTQGTGSAG